MTILIIGGVLVALALLAFLASDRNPRGRSPWARGLVDLNPAQNGRHTDTTGREH